MSARVTYLKSQNEPVVISVAPRGMWYSYVVLPQPKLKLVHAK